jgi:hypothetical protein
VIDVKSRIKIPKCFMVSKPSHTRSYLALMDYLVCPLENLQELPTAELEWNLAQSKLVDRWFEHMNNLRIAYMPDDFTALVLHLPKMPIGKAVLVVSYNTFHWRK